MYSKVVSGNGSSSSSEIEEPSKTLGMVNWLEEYQTEDEHVALQKAINLSKVIFRTSCNIEYYVSSLNSASLSNGRG